MNKQEVIEQINYMDTMNINDKTSGKQLDIIDQIDEPEKPVVPQFVADFYDSIKNDFEHKVYELCLQYKHREDELPKGVAWWFGGNDNKPIETLVMMHKFGYEVQKEKLYTVEIPNPNASEYSKNYLAKNNDGKVELFIWSGYTSIEFADDWKQEENAQLTESEIKKDFAWLWHFAEEVEE